MRLLRVEPFGAAARIDWCDPGEYLTRFRSKCRSAAVARSGPSAGTNGCGPRPAGTRAAAKHQHDPDRPGRAHPVAVGPDVDAGSAVGGAGDGARPGLPGWTQMHQNAHRCCMFEQMVASRHRELGKEGYVVRPDVPSRSRCAARPSTSTAARGVRVEGLQELG